MLLTMDFLYVLGGYSAAARAFRIGKFYALLPCNHSECSCGWVSCINCIYVGEALETKGG